MDNDTPKRLCKKCGNEYPLTAEFWHKDKTAKYGFTYACKECAKSRARQWGQDNAEYVSERNKDYYAENKERVHKPYRKRNAEHIAASKRDWRKRNPDKVKKHKSDSQKRNRPSANMRRKRHYEKHPDQRRAAVLTRIARKKGAIGKYTDKDIQRMYEEQDGRCAYCGIRLFRDIPRDVHVDHIVPLSKGGTNLPENLNLSCDGCNHSKNNHLLDEWMAIRGW